MKALSIKPYFALCIWWEKKTIEIRTWKTDYRGDLLICSTADRMHNTIPRHALCVANLKNIRPLKRTDAEAGMFDPADFEEGLYAWELDNIRTIRPIPIKGKLGLFNVSDDLIEYIPDPDEHDRTRWDEIWEPIWV